MIKLNESHKNISMANTKTDNTPTTTFSATGADEDVVVTPWSVSSKNGIDYMKLISKFGCDPIDGELIKRFERVTRMRAHTWLRRGLFFSCKDLTRILDDFEAGRPIYLYTGRGPSSESMHLGHMVPFMFTAYLQRAFNAVLVVQMSDDEKFAFKGIDEGKTLEHYNRLTFENAKDIIACEFDSERTLIFSNQNTLGGELYDNAMRINARFSGNAIRSIYGLDLDRKVAQIAWPGFQCAPAYSNSFADILHPRSDPSNVYSPELPDGTSRYIGPHMSCLVPMAIDQRPYFAMSRDFVDKFKVKGSQFIKPCEIHSEFLPALAGVSAKMSSSTGGEVIFLTDTAKQIKKKINRGAFSGGKETVELHQRYGGNLENDVAYQYMLYFNEDDVEMAQIANDYRSGKMLTGQIKKRMIECVCEFVERHQANRAKVTDDVLRHFFNRNRAFDLSREEREPLELHADEVYAGYGINFDRTFGAVAPEGALEYEEKLMREMFERDAAESAAAAGAGSA